MAVSGTPADRTSSMKFLPSYYILPSVHKAALELFLCSSRAIGFPPLFSVLQGVVFKCKSVHLICVSLYF